MSQRDSLPDQRPARASEKCKCGRPALVVYITEKFGEVPYCGIPDGGAAPGRYASPSSDKESS